MRISIPLKTILAESKTYLSSNITSGTTALTVQNNSNFAVNNYVILGKLGEEYSEIRQILSITGKNTITLSAGASFDHPTNCLIQKVDFDHLKIERGENSSAFTEITTYFITGDEREYEYNDTTGTSSSYYRVRFCNFQTGAYSDYSNSFTLATPSPVDALIDDILRKLQAEGDQSITDNDIFNAISDTVMRVQMEISRTNPDYLKTSTSISLLSGIQEYPLPSNCMWVTRVMVKYTGADDFRETRKLRQESGDFITDQGGAFSHYSYRDLNGVQMLGLTDIPGENVTGGLKVFYVSQPKRPTSITDVINVPYVLSFLHVIKDGALAELYRHFKNRDDLAQRLEERFEKGVYEVVQIINDNDMSEGVQETSSGLMEIYNAYS